MTNKLITLNVKNRSDHDLPYTIDFTKLRNELELNLLCTLKKVLKNLSIRICIIKIERIA